jgi:hypothetical protein
VRGNRKSNRGTPQSVEAPGQPIRSRRMPARDERSKRAVFPVRKVPTRYSDFFDINWIRWVQPKLSALKPYSTFDIKMEKFELFRASTVGPFSYEWTELPRKIYRSWQVRPMPKNQRQAKKMIRGLREGFIETTSARSTAVARPRPPQRVRISTVEQSTHCRGPIPVY